MLLKIIKHMVVSYPYRVYSTTKFSVTFPLDRIGHKADAKLLLVAADHYLALPCLQYNLVPIDQRHIVKTADHVTISLTIESRLVESSGSYFFSQLLGIRTRHLLDVLCYCMW